jgi:hypothetical protein
VILLARLTAFLAAGAIAVPMIAGAANAVIPAQWKNCTQVNKRYPHGIGKVGARDKTTGAPAVTTFKRSTWLYRIAMSFNRRLDRDKDAIAPRVGQRWSPRGSILSRQSLPHRAELAWLSQRSCAMRNFGQRPA